MAGSSFFSKHLKHMFHPKHIAAVLIAMCLASTGDAASRLEPPGAAEKMTIQPRGRAYLFRGFIGLLTDRGMDKLTERINRTGVTADVNSYLMWRGLADQAITDYRYWPLPGRRCRREICRTPRRRWYSGEPTGHLRPHAICPQCTTERRALCQPLSVL